uniref:Uncharacterized protein n=1 Tax=Lactuca sativa TaxID=4236 RepID=A0A9R1WWG0_LACSA|nr:hypothetical protein LSAT_V11C800411020 [Lactuca sativa]
MIRKVAAELNLLFIIQFSLVICKMPHICPSHFILMFFTNSPLQTIYIPLFNPQTSSSSINIDPETLPRLLPSISVKSRLRLPNQASKVV